jgi:hypothetical protein
MSSFAASAIPLMDALPWKREQPCTVVVYDSIESEARFVSYQMAAASDACYWLAGGPYTRQLVQTGLKKMKCGSSNNNDSKVTIRCVGVELAEQWAAETKPSALDRETYVKSIYEHIKTWVSSQSEGVNAWIILDDMSALACLLGERLISKFIASVHSILRMYPVGLLVRCSNDYDQELFHEINSEQSSPYDWFGAGGEHAQRPMEEVPWERSLSELADAIVDVSPLAGMREAHGRLVATYHGKTTVFNYSLHDTKVLAIRIRNV